MAERTDDVTRSVVTEGLGEDPITHLGTEYYEGMPD